MINDSVIEQVRNLDIVDIIEKNGVNLKKSGSNYKGLSPFNKEKTPSFMVSPSKQIFKCFSSGKGGDGITFIQETTGGNFREAVEELAKQFNIPLPEKELTDEEKKKYQERESLYTANEIIAKWFCQNLYKPENSKVLKYALSRWNKETLTGFRIGYAPNAWQDLLNFGIKYGLKADTLIKAALVKKSEKGKLFDYFRNRLIIPLHNKNGRIVGFTGRYIGKEKNQPKYLNTSETEIFNKSILLFGINKAWFSIKDKTWAYLVEGQPDVIKLHQINITNTIATGGTSLTPEQIKLFSSICKSIVIIPDGDAAGIKSLHRSAKMLIEQGIIVNVMKLPVKHNQKGEEIKEDPDSFFTSEKQFKDYANENITDYINYLAYSKKSKSKNADFKYKLIHEISDLIAYFKDESLRNIYIDQVGDIIKPKKAWEDEVKKILRDKSPGEEKQELPKKVDFKDYTKYGFYEDDNRYYFNQKGNAVEGTNFVMRPLFHIKSISNAKRLYEIINEFSHSEVIELAQKDLISLQGFKLRVESLGNFIWKAGDVELNRLKRYLYENTQSAIEVTQMGWQKNGFFAWSNGIFNGEFTPINHLGIAGHNDSLFYIPARSDFFKNDPLLYMSERNFIHTDANNTISLHDYSQMLIKVFGDNAKIAICFYMATLFRDYIVRKLDFFPILNLFGPKGSGKTGLAVSILQFFGKHKAGPNINNTTIAALSDHVSQVANACVHIDEYKNSIDFVKVEFVKGLWDGTGRSRMNMDKDKKKETTSVDSGIILTGQEMPTADNALFSRLIFLTFYASRHTDEEMKRYENLKNIEKKGLTHITNDILKNREHFIKNYITNLNHVIDDLRDKVSVKLEDRLLKNWSVPIAAFKTLQENINLPFNYANLVKTAADKISQQQSETTSNNEVSIFWNIVQYLYADGLIQEEVDYKVEYCTSLKTDLIKIEKEFPEPTRVLFIQHSRIFTLYRKHGKMAGEKILPTESLDYYLRNSDSFLGKTTTRFKTINPETGRIWKDEEFGSVTIKKSKAAKSYCFLYDTIDISIVSDTEEEDMLSNSITDNTTNNRYEKDDKLPF